MFARRIISYFLIRQIPKAIINCTLVGTSGSWAGAVAGAKIGALLGAATDLAAPVAVPLLSFAGGVVGSFGGDALGRWIVDITVVEE